MDNMNDKTIELIRVLRKNGKLQTSDIAEKIGTSTRNTRRHIELAKKLGYNIVSSYGLYGGLELIEESLEDYEWETISKKLDSKLFEKLKRIINKV